MPLSPKEASLIIASYRVIQQHTVSYSDLFYHRLLDCHPFTRTLFPDDMAHQAGVFRRTIDSLIDQLDRVDTLQPALAELARRHVCYGVQARHYAIVGEVLIETFAEMLGDRFCSNTRGAWITLYDATAGVMIAEAYPQTTG